MCRERPCCERYIATRNARLLGGVLPTVHGASHFFDNFLGTRGRSPVKLRRAQNRLKAWTVVHIIKVQDVFPLVDVRVHIKGGSKPPTCRGQHEAVIAQVVVPVAHRHIESHPAKQLRQVFGNVGAVTVGAKELCHLQVACALTVLLTQQRHRRGVEPPCAACAIKALHAEGVKRVVQAHRPRRRHVHASYAGQTVHHMFPCANVSVIVARRKLANPQGAIRLGEICFGARSTQGCAWRHQHG